MKQKNQVFGLQEACFALWTRFLPIQRKNLVFAGVEDGVAGQRLL